LPALILTGYQHPASRGKHDYFPANTTLFQGLAGYLAKWISPYNQIKQDAPPHLPEIRTMLFILYYVIAIIVLVLHFTGVLARYNLEWLVLALAVTVFPAVIYL
jgi:hypothetical protein